MAKMAEAASVAEGHLVRAEDDDGLSLPRDCTTNHSPSLLYFLQYAGASRAKVGNWLMMATTRTTALARCTSSIRGVRSLSTTATFLQATRTTRTIRTPSFAAAHSYRQPPIAAQPTQRRLLSTDEPAQPRSYSFSQIQGLSSSKPSEQDPVLIDVREPHEFQNGRIPTSQNLPITSSPEGLLLPADEFEERFGFEKPTADREVVFYCKAGVRSRAAARIAVQAGYQKVGEYQGSWVDWERNGGEIEK